MENNFSITNNNIINGNNSNSIKNNSSIDGSNSNSIKNNNSMNISNYIMERMTILSYSAS
jgi:hypothetical protein